jgi:Nif-specific regulatory protein
MQEREFEHLGGTKTIKVDVRIVAATNRDLEEMVRAESFRKDLYYRLSVVPINVPPLRERKEDIPSLVDYFLLESSSISGKSKKTITEAAMLKLIEYNWPGNIRELENIIERCVVITPEAIINLEDLPDYIRDFEESDAEGLSSHKLNNAVDIAEKETILKMLKECNGNRTKASELLGISRRSLHRKIAKYNIEE